MRSLGFRLLLLGGLTVCSTAVLADPSLLAEYDDKGGVSFSFVADPGSAIAALQIELPLRASQKGARVPELCLQPPKGFSALCNVDGEVFKAVVYSTNPDAAMPSASLGRVQFPAGALSIAKSGEVEGLVLKTFDGMAKSMPSEVLSAPERAGRRPGAEQQR